MEQKPTRKKILDSALTLFSENGYDAVSVNQIADAVGIKAPSLYKHFQSKRDIFTAILDVMKGKYEQQAAALQMTGSRADEDAGVFLNSSEEQLVQRVNALFLYFLHDEYTRKFRKMLTVEQYHNKELAALFSKQYVDAPLSYQGKLFGALIQDGVLKPESLQIIALHFYAPIYLLLNLCDRQPERESEAMGLLEQHIRQFNRIYKSENQEMEERGL